MPPAAAADESLTWDLSDLYASPGDPAIDTDTALAREIADGMAAAHRGKVADLSPAQLASLLAEYERLLDRLWRPVVYASLRFAADTRDTEAQALIARTREQATETSTRVKFLDIEIKTSSARRSPPGSPRRSWRRTATSSTPPAATRRTPSRRPRSVWPRSRRSPAWPPGPSSSTRRWPRSGCRSRSRASSATSRWTRRGRCARRGIAICGLAPPSPSTRRTASAPTSSPIAPTLLDDELSAETVETLMATTEKNYGLAQRYYAAKGKILGLPHDFASHDLLAPLPGRAQ